MSYSNRSSWVCSGSNTTYRYEGKSMIEYKTIHWRKFIDAMAQTNDGDQIILTIGIQANRTLLLSEKSNQLWNPFITLAMIPNTSANIPHRRNRLHILFVLDSKLFVSFSWKLVIRFNVTAAWTPSMVVTQAASVPNIPKSSIGLGHLIEGSSMQWTRKGCCTWLSPNISRSM